MNETVDAKLLIEQGDVVGILKAKYFAVKEAISDAEERHTKAVDGLNEPKAKTVIAMHEAELLKARIAKTKESIRVKKEALSEVKEDLGEANEEIQENKVVNQLLKGFKGVFPHLADIAECDIQAESAGL